MSVALTVATKQVTRADLMQAFNGNLRLVRVFEQLLTDIRTNIPDAIVQTSDLSGAPFLLTAASSLAPNGSVLTAGAGVTVTTSAGATTVALNTPLAVSVGGTGATNAASARLNLGAAASGANSDITSLAGLTTPLPITEGGTGQTTAAAALTALGGVNGAYVTGQFAAPPILGSTAPNVVHASQLIVNETGSSSTQSLAVSATSDTNGANILLLGNGATTPSKTVRAVNGLFQVVNSAYSATPLSMDDAGNLTLSGYIEAQMSRVVAGDTNAQSIPNNAFTIITGWTATVNKGANLNTVTGIYTCPLTGQYDVRAAARFASATWVATGIAAVAVAVNGTQVNFCATQIDAAATLVPQAHGAWIVNCNANDQISIQVFQNSGAALALTGQTTVNYLHISQLP